MRLGPAVIVSLVLLGCESDSAGPQEAGEGSTSTSGESPGTTSTGEASGSSSGEASGSSDSGSTGTEAPSFGEPESLPTPDGACPTFSTDVLEFHPGETGPRQARVWYDPESGGGGPVVFYWHGTGSSPNEATFGLGPAAIDDILARGGMVVAPVADPEAGQFPWFLVLGQREDDLHLMDEILGCAAEGPGVDASRIHAIGMSAGGLQTSQASVRRSSYLASVVAYSGGLLSEDIPSADLDRPFPAMIYHGGPDDIVVVSFQQTSENYESYLDARDGFTVMCDHGGGHSIPDSRVYSWQFMLDHPFGITPFPYGSELPSWVPDYCVD